MPNKPRVSDFELSEDVKEALEELNEANALAYAEKQNYNRDVAPTIKGNEVSEAEWKNKIAEEYAEENREKLFASFKDMAKFARKFPKLMNENPNEMLNRIEANFDRAEAEFDFYRACTEMKEQIIASRKLTDERAAVLTKKIKSMRDNPRLGMTDSATMDSDLLVIEHLVILAKKNVTSEDKARMEDIKKELEKIKKYRPKDSPKNEAEENEPEGHSLAGISPILLPFSATNQLAVAANSAKKATIGQLA